MKSMSAPETAHSYKTSFTYDLEDRVTELSYGWTGGDKVTCTYDALGRITERKVIFSGHTYTTGYSYLTGQNGLTTPLVSGIAQSGENLAYTYDACGNILTVTRDGQTAQYTYDALNRLTRSNDPWNRLGGTAGATMTYEYDLGGNVKKLKRHAYTTGTPAAAQQTVSLGYTNTGWKDLATTFNNQAIQNDAIGNTLQTSIWSYEWEHGRQLKQVSNSRDHQTTTFLYNEEGLRVRKTVVTAATATNPVSTTEVTDYTLHGKNIVHLTKGTDSLHFYYDAQNRPALVQWYNGATANTYAYIYDLQGDVIGLLDSTGAEVVRYAYNDYGLPAMRTGTLANTLGLLNPFRYRCYVYDDETQLYYLRSRYYNPYRGRFINADSVFDGANLFSYCGNEPVNRLDKNGKTAYHVGVTNAASVRFRSQPIICSDTQLMVLPKGTELILKEDPENKGWYKTIIGGQEGFIKAEFIDVLMEGNSIIYSYGNKNLRRSNYYSLYVKHLQEKLNEQELIDKNGVPVLLTVDGYYGSATEDAVILYQKTNPVLWDEPRGIVTYTMMQELGAWMEELGG